MRYAREVGVQKPWGATDKVAGQSPIFSGQKSPEKRPKKDPKNGLFFAFRGWKCVLPRLGEGLTAFWFVACLDKEVTTTDKSNEIRTFEASFRGFGDPP